MNIRRFAESDAIPVSEMIARTLRVSNSADYSAEYIEDLILRQNPERIKDLASRSHFYVIENRDGIVGCGAIVRIPDKEEECCFSTVFVSPEYQGKGIGRTLIGTLEKDELYTRAKRVEVAASITALGFYEKLGYVKKFGVTDPDEKGLYRLEKIK